MLTPSGWRQTPEHNEQLARKSHDLVLRVPGTGAAIGGSRLEHCASALSFWNLRKRQAS
jgi:hypothetical protein